MTAVWHYILQSYGRHNAWLAPIRYLGMASRCLALKEEDRHFQKKMRIQSQSSSPHCMQHFNCLIAMYNVKALRHRLDLDIELSRSPLQQRLLSISSRWRNWLSTSTEAELYSAMSTKIPTAFAIDLIRPLFPHFGGTSVPADPRVFTPSWPCVPYEPLPLVTKYRRYRVLVINVSAKKLIRKICE